MSVPGVSVLFSESEIADRVQAMARAIAASEHPPQIVAPVLVGAFVFAADLVRALAREGVHPRTEMLWLRSYGEKRTADAIQVINGPSENVKGRHILLVDGVLDIGRTVMKATQLLNDAGAASVKTAVAIDKMHHDAVARADWACFTGIKDFIVGYGMDDAGKYRALPYIGKVEPQT